jgi:hypothetical protein
MQYKQANTNRQAKTENEAHNIYPKPRCRTGSPPQTGRPRQKDRAGQAGSARQDRQAKTDTHTIFCHRNYWNLTKLLETKLSLQDKN